MANNESIELVLVFGPNGELQAGVPDGATFEQAAPALKRFLASIGRPDLKIELKGEPESHRDGAEHLHVHAPGINDHTH